jgi:hypothetical protein
MNIFINLFIEEKTERAREGKRVIPLTIQNIGSIEDEKKEKCLILSCFHLI